MRYLRSFGRFWWNFIVGDDWSVAAGVAGALGVTALLTHENGNTRGALLGTFEATRNNGSVAMRLGTNTVPGAAIVFGGTGCPSASSKETVRNESSVSTGRSKRPYERSSHGL